MTSSVLVVDPARSVVASFVKVFEASGYVARDAYGYADAVRALCVSEPDVLVVSVELGTHNGLHLAMRCAIDHPSIIVIVIGPSSTALESEARALGAAAYLPRPQSPEAVAARVAALLPAHESGALDHTVGYLYQSHLPAAGPTP